MRRRSFLAPETLQISSMDCGVGALTTYLAGFGLHANYEALREACQTSIDGTSIDALEDLANELGVQSCQHLVPRDWFVEALDRRLPAIVPTFVPGLPPHFVVVWRKVGDWVHVMDPNRGRMWIRKEELARNLFVVLIELGPDEFRGWFASSTYRELLARLADELLERRAAAEVQRSLDVPESAEVLATLDGALRTTAALDPERRRGARWRTRAFERIRAAVPTEPNVVPQALRGLVAGPDGGLRVRSTVALAPESPEHPVRASGPAPRRGRVLATSAAKPWVMWQRLAGLLGRDARALMAACSIGLVAAAVTSGLEVLSYRAAWDAPRTLSTLGQRLGAVGVVVALLALVMLLEAGLTWGSRALGRYLEVRLRVLTCELLPKVSDEFIRSRPTSDLAYRVHGLSLGRELPGSVVQALRAVLDLVVAVIALALLDVGNLALATGGLLALLALSRYGAARLREIDMRFQAHGSRLLSIFLDSLRGFRPLRLHGYQNAFRAEQDREVLLWSKSGLEQASVRAALRALDEALGILLLLGFFLLHVERSGDPRVFVILAFWGFRIPGAVRTITAFVEKYPAQRSAFVRLLEIALYATDDERSTEAREEVTLTAGVSRERGVRIELDHVSVLANGHELLSEVTLEIPPGQHVAVVGPSGAGKSSLASVLLGIHSVSSGTVLVDGERLDRERLDWLRRRTAWVDPAAQLWNDSLLANLEYAARGHRRRDLLETFDSSDLLSVLEGMGQGLGTNVGSEGRLVSGGEGQRIRLGRALLRADATLVVLDEPFRGLDRATRRRLAFRARLAWKRATVLFISHDIEHALDFDRVLVVDGGRVVEDGHPLELAGTRSRFGEMLEAERRVLDETWAPRQWRRLRVEDGVVREVST